MEIAPRVGCSILTYTDAHVSDRTLNIPENLFAMMQGAQEKILSCSHEILQILARSSGDKKCISQISDILVSLLETRNRLLLSVCSKKQLQLPLTRKTLVKPFAFRWF